MKHLIKCLFCLSLLFALTFTLVGCTNDNDDNKDDKQTNETTNNDRDDKDDFDEIDTRITNEFNGDYQLNRNDVVDAVNYINNNLDNVKDKEVAKKLYEKGRFLEVAASSADVGDDDTIRNLGIKAKNYASRIYRAKDNEVDGIINDAKDDFDEFSAKLGDGIDDAVDNFMNFFDGNKNE